MLDWKIPVGPIGRVLLFVTVWLLLLPWLAIECAVRLGDIARAVRRLVELPRRALASHTPCPRGHRSLLLGVWECRTCGSLFAGYAFQGCPICASHCGYVTCEHCGLAVRNPFL